MDERSDHPLALCIQSTCSRSAEFLAGVKWEGSQVGGLRAVSSRSLLEGT